MAALATFWKNFTRLLKMANVQPLPADRLHATLDPDRLPWKDSRKIPYTRLAKLSRRHFQPRAMQALELALNIDDPGYHIYLSGETDLGRSYMLLSWLKPLAAKGQTSPDLVYVQDFNNSDAPILIQLPPGMGRKLKTRIKALIENIKNSLERRLETLNFVRQRAKLMKQYQEERSDLLRRMTNFAENKGFALEIDENGLLALSPLSGGKKLNDDDLEKIDAYTRLDLKRKGENVAKNLLGLLRQFNKAEESLHDHEQDLEHAAMEQTLNALFTPLSQRLLKNFPSQSLKKYLEDLRGDILINTSAFLPKDSPFYTEEQHNADNFFNRYDINIFVDNSGLNGAPVIVEDNPNFANLLGCVERETELGTLVTDFTLIRSGSLHKANGGFLILHADDILQHPLAWEGLLRTLRSAQARIEDSGEIRDESIRPKGLHPQPLALNLKVILIGDEDLYEALLINEERFAKLFGIKAHMTDQIQRTPANIRFYLGQIAQIIAEADLLPFDASALAWLVDLGSHLSEDQCKLSLKFPLLREMMLEAAALAKMQSMTMVNAALLEQTYANKTYRANLLEESFMEDYDRQLIKLSTSGSAIGQVNGLSITWTGDFEFGLPHRISCTVGVGHEGIIDLEREADLGGPIHTKAMMILKSYLTGLFAWKKPLVLNASLYFEQSYGGIEGDSASGAELVALLSALANVPVRLDLAFTGAVSDSGQIMAVGGVTRKIEGFYKVCKRHGLTGTQGVIIPTDNIEQLMLAPEVLKSVEKNEFAIYPVRSMDEALFLLTGMNVGKRRKNGSFTPDSLFDKVDKRLEALGCYAQNSFRNKRKD